MQPLVSVLIAAYNAEPWLAETLDSALGQTWPRTEVIVVDDGSTDGTLAVARRYRGRVRVVAQENAGACAARNAALALAQGDFVQYLDADDLLDPEKIEVQVRRLAGEPPGTVASSAWSRFYGDDLGTADLTPQPGWRDFDPAHTWLIEAWKGCGMMPLFGWLIPRAVAEAAGPWDETLRRNQDGEYNARVLTRAAKIAFCPEAWGYYRSGMAGSISRRRDDGALRSLFDSYALCQAHLLGVDDSAEARHAVACSWQTFLFTVYPRVPDLVREAEARVRALGGGSRTPGVSRPFRPVRDLIGWKPALRLQRLWYRLRYPEYL